MEYIRRVVMEGNTRVTKLSEWTQEEVEAHRGRIGEYIMELRPRKRVRRQDDGRQGTLATSSSRNVARQTPTPTTPPSAELRRSPIYDVIEPTTPPSLQELRVRQGGASDLLFDTVHPPPVGDASQSFSLTGATLPPSLQANGTPAPESHTSAAAPAATQTQSSVASGTGGMNATTEAIIIAASIAGVIIIVSMIVLFSICYRRKKRRSTEGHPLAAVPNRTKSTSTVQSDGWRSESSEVEKQALIRGHSASRSPSPASRVPNQQPTHAATRSINVYTSRLPQIPESPHVNPIDRPASPTSIYTKAISPPQPTDPGQLQVDMPLSPLRPPPLRLHARHGSEAPVGTALLPSPRNPFSVRIPFFSGTPSDAGKRRSSMGRSMSSAGYDEERAAPNNRRTVESDTLPKPAGYRDSLWSVAASSFWGGSSNKFKSTYSEWNAVPSSAALSHTRSTSRSSQGGHSRGQSTIDTGFTSEPSTATGAPSHLSGFSGRVPSGALIPALPPMPSAQQLQQQYGHKTTMSNASEGSMADGNVQFKGRLHSVDFWAREEREMRLGTFEPAELDGTPSPGLAPPALSTAASSLESPEDTVSALASETPGNAYGVHPKETMSRGRLGADPYSNGFSGPGAYGVTGGMQGGYTVTVSGGNSPPMPQGYTQEADDGRHLWGRSRSRSRSRGRNSASTVATVFKQHPGDMVMI